MRGFSFITLLLIPAMVALGHDTYLFYINHVEPHGLTLDLILKEFKFSALGFIWTTYYEEGYKTAVGAVDPETWTIIDYLLTFKAFYVCLGFTGLMIVIYGIIGMLFGKGPLALEGGRVFYASEKKSESFRAGQESKKFNYKRK